MARQNQFNPFNTMNPIKYSETQLWEFARYGPMPDDVTAADLFNARHTADPRYTALHVAVDKCRLPKNCTTAELIAVDYGHGMTGLHLGLFRGFLPTDCTMDTAH